MSITEVMENGAETFLGSIHELEDNSQHWFVVSVKDIEERPTVIGKTMGLLDLSDNTGCCSAIVFPTIYGRLKGKVLFNGSIMRVKCCVEHCVKASRLVVVEAEPWVAGRFESV